MTHSDEGRRENAALRKGASTLNAAILQFNASLDIDTVLGKAAPARIGGGPPDLTVNILASQGGLGSRRLRCAARD